MGLAGAPSLSDRGSGRRRRMAAHVPRGRPPSGNGLAARGEEREEREAKDDVGTDSEGGSQRDGSRLT